MRIIYSFALQKFACSKINQSMTKRVLEKDKNAPSKRKDQPLFFAQGLNTQNTAKSGVSVILLSLSLMPIWDVGVRACKKTGVD